MSHTPGPWYVRTDGTIGSVQRGGMVVAHAVIEPKNQGDSASNARLIAAAPDLLAFAESVVTLFAKEYPQAGLHLDMDKASLLNAAREVIKKARDQ